MCLGFHCSCCVCSFREMLYFVVDNMNISGLLEFACCMSAIEGFVESVGFLISLARPLCLICSII